MQKYIPIFGVSLGIFVFFNIYGYEILNPTFIEWTMKGDAAQHFLGWHFFRSEAWTFPLGTISSYMYPQGTSIVFTDSIPLLAIPLKLISSLLPPVFQYHGIWLLVCYILQGYFAVLLLRIVTNEPLLIFLGTLFFLLSPIMVQRAYPHEALSAHWIILASIYLYFQRDEINNRAKWIFLLIVAVMVHFYLFAMSFAIYVAYLLKALMENYKVNSEIKKRGESKFQEFNWIKSKPIVDQIDEVISRHFGLSIEETDFIINYDIKYRMG